MAQQVNSPMLDIIPPATGMDSTTDPSMLETDKCQLILNLMNDRPGILRSARHGVVYGSADTIYGVTTSLPTNVINDSNYAYMAGLSISSLQNPAIVAACGSGFRFFTVSGYDGAQNPVLSSSLVGAYDVYSGVFFSPVNGDIYTINAAMAVTQRGIIAAFPQNIKTGITTTAQTNWQAYDLINLSPAGPLYSWEGLSLTEGGSPASPFPSGTVLNYAMCATDANMTMFGAVRYFSATIGAGLGAYNIQATPVASSIKYWALFRSLQGADGIYYLVATFQVGTTYTDTSTDASIQGNITAPDANEYYPFRPFTIVANHNGRTVTNDAYFPTNIQISTYDNPYMTSNPTGTDVNGNLNTGDGAILRVGVGEADVVTGLASTGTALYILTQGAQYIMTGTDPNSWVVQPLTRSHGCIGPNTVAVSGNHVYYLGYDGVYRIKGVTVEKISHAIDASIQPLLQGNQTENYALQATGWQAFNAYNVCIGNTIYRYDEVTNGWTTWQFGVEPVNGATVFYDGFGKYEMLISQYKLPEMEYAIVSQQPENGVNAAPVSARYVTRPIGGTQARQLIKRLIRMQAYGSGVVSVASATIYTDNSSYTFTPNILPSNADGFLFLQEFPDYVQGRVIYLDLQLTGSNLKIGQINTFYDEVRA